MKAQPFHRRIVAIVAGVAIAAFSSMACADPPSRVARLGYMTGAVSFSPAGEVDWVRAAINRPLTTGDRLWVDAGARAELQVGGAMIRVHAGTAVSIINLDDRVAQLQLTQGTLNVRVRRLGPDQIFEVDTPNLAFTLRQPGEYRMEVDPDNDATTIFVRKGQGEVYGEGAAYVVDSRQSYSFMGTGLREFEYVDVEGPDEFDRWASDRDRRYDGSVSARYVSQDVIGYQDLDANGTWRVDATYGNVWFPNRVAAGWAPYSDGHWAWVDPWGWTWVDDAPWGFAVSHYGRWTNMRGTWGWVPGPLRSRAYYAPALVAFVGGSNFQLSISGGNVGGVAWFPLGPREVYRPSYAVSRGYFENVNRSNTVVNITTINNYYNNTNDINVAYVNRQVPGAIVAVPATTFMQSKPVSAAAVPVSREMIASAPIAVVPRVAPTEASVRGAASSGGKPPARVFEKPVVARTAPPAAPVGFAAQRQQLAAKPGTPLDEAARRELKPAAAVPAPVVNVVVQPQKAPPTLRPPPAAPGAKPGDAQTKPAESKAPAAPTTSGAPGAPPQRVAPAVAVPPPRIAPPATAAPAAPPATQPPEQRAKPEQRGRTEQPAAPPPEQRGRTEQRIQPAAPPPAPPQRVTPVPAAPARVAPPAPTAPPPEQRGRTEQRPQPAAPPPEPPQRVTPVPAAPAKVAPPAPAAPPPEQRAKPEQRGRTEQPGQPAAPPPAPPQRVTPVPAAPAKVAPPAPAAPPPEQRGRTEQRIQPAAPPPTPATPPAPPQRATPVPVAPAKIAPPAPTAPTVQPRAQEPKSAADKLKDKKDADEKARDEESRKPKG